MKSIERKLKVNRNQLKVLKSIERKLKVNWNPYLSWLTKKLLGGAKKNASYRVSSNCLRGEGGPHTNQQRTLYSIHGIHPLTSFNLRIVLFS